MADRDIAVIVGVGPGLGQALARKFAAEGADVAMLARNADRLADLAEEIGGPTTVRGYSADATDLASLRAAIDRVTAEMGPPTILIHNVSRFIPAPGTELDPETLADELTLGATAALAASQAVMGGMRAAGHGTILWTGSAMGLRPEAAARDSPALAAGKGALRGLAHGVAGAFHDLGINFSTITINGGIKEGGPFDPARIAEAFWAAHTAPREGWQAERIFEGA